MYDMLFWIIIVLMISVLIIGINDQTIESFGSKAYSNYTKSRSVELYNPSNYSGMFVRKFDVPDAYTRLNARDPLLNQLSITKQYKTKGDHYTMMTQNIIVPMWNVANVYPLRNRPRNLI